MGKKKEREEERAQEAREKEAWGQEEQAREEGKAQEERREERKVEAQEGHDGEEVMTTQENFVETKKGMNSMNEENDVSNRHMTWWRNAWWVRMDSGPHLRTAQGRRKVASSHESRAGNARDRKGRRGRKGRREEKKATQMSYTLYSTIPLQQQQQQQQQQQCACNDARDFHRDGGQQDLLLCGWSNSGGSCCVRLLGFAVYARLLVIELAEFPKVLAVAEAVAKDPCVESYLKVNSMGKPELIDFDLTDRGELTQLAFIAGGVDFTDTRHSFDAWPALKGHSESILPKMIRLHAMCQTR